MKLLGNERRFALGRGRESILRSSLTQAIALLVAAILAMVALSGLPATAHASTAQQLGQADDVSLMAARIDTVKLTGEEPVAGKVCGAALTSAEPWVYNVSGVDWYDETAGRYLDPSDTFIAGHKYTMQAYVDAQPGYAFLLDGNNLNAPLVNGTFNGKSTKTYKITGYDPNETIMLVRSFEVAKAKITSVKVLNVDEPVAGAAPDYEATVGDPSLYWLAPYGYAMSGMWWMDSEGAVLSSNDTFKAGETYQLEVKLVPAMNGSDPQAMFNTPITATVNGKSVLAVNIWANEDEVYLFVDYTAKDTTPKAVSAVEVSGIDLPVAGKTPDYTASVGNPELYALAPYGYEKSGLWWYDSKGATVAANEKFRAGETYQLEIKLESKVVENVPKCTFVKPMTAKVNGQSVPAVSISANDHNVYLFLEYKCEGNGEGAFTDLWQSFPDVVGEVNKVGGPDKVWYVADGWLDYVVANGLMGGYTSNGYFGPRDKITRGQVATILYRAEVAEDPLLYYVYGSTTEPAAYATSSTFKDVAGKKYYTAAVNWAKEAGIMTGDASTNYQTVRPNDPVTRQELVTMLCRYATSKHVNTITDQSIAGYSDAGKVANWAKPSVAWAVERGIMGSTAKLNPTGNATRAEAAKMFTVVMRDVIE